MLYGVVTLLDQAVHEIVAETYSQPQLQQPGLVSVRISVDPTAHHNVAVLVIHQRATVASRILDRGVFASILALVAKARTHFRQQIYVHVVVSGHYQAIDRWKLVQPVESLDLSLAFAVIKIYSRFARYLETQQYVADTVNNLGYLQGTLLLRRFRRDCCYWCCWDRRRWW